MTEPLTQQEIEALQQKPYPNIDDLERLLATIDARDKRIAELETECEALSALNRAQDEGLANYEAHIAALERVVEAAQEDLADAKANCGGDGEGCEPFRAYFENAAVRHRKCGQCPMEAISETAAALASLDATQEKGGDDGE